MKTKEERQKSEGERRLRIHRDYHSRILQTRTVRDCENILQRLARDEDIPSSIYWDIYKELEERARFLKTRQEAIAKETAAAIHITEKMAPHFRP